MIEKPQLIYLLSFGIDETFMRHVKPSIQIGEHYLDPHRPSGYKLIVTLINDKFKKVNEFRLNNYPLDGLEDGWKQVTHTSSYKPEYDLIENILFYHAGVVSAIY